MTDSSELRAQVNQVLLALASTRTTGEKANARELAAAFQAATALRHLLDAADTARPDRRVEALTYATRYADWAGGQAREILDEISLHASLDALATGAAASADRPARTDPH
jgi:hypothetical protein